jgi:hypothetical protein
MVPCLSMCCVGWAQWAGALQALATVYSWCVLQRRVPAVAAEVQLLCRLLAQALRPEAVSLPSCQEESISEPGMSGATPGESLGPAVAQFLPRAVETVDQDADTERDVSATTLGLPLVCSSRYSCACFVSLVAQGIEPVLRCAGRTLLGRLLGLGLAELPLMEDSEAADTDSAAATTGPAMAAAGAGRRLQQAYEAGNLAASAAALRAKQYLDRRMSSSSNEQARSEDIGGHREGVPNATVSAEFFAEMDDKTQWRKEDWLYSNRQRKKDGFWALRREWDDAQSKGFLTEQERRERERNWRPLVRCFLYGGHATTAAPENQAHFQLGENGRLHTRNYPWFAQFFQQQLLHSSFSERADAQLQAQLQGKLRPHANLDASARKKDELFLRMTAQQGRGGGGGGGGGGGESFLRVHWVAVPEALRARRVNRRWRQDGYGSTGGRRPHRRASRWRRRWRGGEVSRGQRKAAAAAAAAAVADEEPGQAQIVQARRRRRRRGRAR